MITHLASSRTARGRLKTLCGALALLPALGCSDSPGAPVAPADALADAAVTPDGATGDAAGADAVRDAPADGDAGAADVRPDDAIGDAEPDADVMTDTTASGPSLRLSAQAVPSCGSWAPDHQPQLHYQTPKHVRLGVLQVWLLRGHDDPAPVALPSAGGVAEVDASAGGTLAEVALGALPAARFTHVRVRLATSHYELAATAHGAMIPGGQVAGTLAMDTVLSDHTDAAGVPQKQGAYTATFSAFGQSFSSSGSFPLNCTLSAWGGVAMTTGGRFEVTVPLPTGGLDLTGGPPQGPEGDLELTLPFPIQDAFPWRDQEAAGFADGVLDVSAPPAGSEVPDSLVDCGWLMTDRCQGEATNPIHPTWPMPDSHIDYCVDGAVMAQCPAPGEPWFGQDGNYDDHAMSYTVTADTVTDDVTGLEWQREESPTPLDWWDARDYCAGLDLAGHEDWRLPSRVELVSLLDYGALDPTIDLDAFPTASSELYWSASPVPFQNLAYGVRFELGFIYDHDPFGTGAVRCVRGAYAPPDPRFTFDADTVTDQGTGLVWQRGHLPAQDWPTALASCQGLDLAGVTDWRLPTLKETQTLVDARRLQPAIDVVAFPDTPPEWFWSSTPITVPPNEAWATSYTDGYASIHAFTELQLVRCVRSP